MNTSNVISKKPHWFDKYQENLIEQIEIEKRNERNDVKREKRALKILKKLPQDLVNFCLEFLDEKFKKKNYLTKITNVFKKYIGNLDNLNSCNYEEYPIYKLLEDIPEKILIRFIKSGTPSKYYQKIFNNTLFNNYKVTNTLHKTLVQRYGGHNKLSYDVCAWEITKLVRFSFTEIIIEGENLFNTDFKKYKEYDLHFKKYEKYTTRLINSVVYLHNKYTN